VLAIVFANPIVVVEVSSATIAVVLLAAIDVVAPATNTQ